MLEEGPGRPLSPAWEALLDILLCVDLSASRARRGSRPCLSPPCPLAPLPIW